MCFMKQDLEILILKNNSLSELPIESFSSLSKLKHLDISHNNLLSLNGKVFKGLNSLETLHLDFNDIELSSESFAGLPNLRRLSISYNSLAFLPSDVFHTISTLQHLELSSNKLLSISPSIFSSLPSLKTVKLDRNLISTLESGIFSAQKELQILDLSNNLISDIEEGAFFGLHSLQLLNLTNNQMSAFVSLSSLHWLSLSHSSLITLSPAAFSPHPPLRYLDLSYNQLTSIPSNFLPNNKVHKIFLAGNPWECACDLRALSLNPQDQAICAGPEGMAALKLSQLKPCPLFAGMFIPVLLTIVVLFLCAVILVIACYRPNRSRKNPSNFYNDPLINVLTHKEIAFDRPICSPYTSPTEINGADSSSGADSAYESPTSAQARRLLLSYSGSKNPHLAGASLGRSPPRPMFVGPPLPQIIPPLNSLNSSRLTVYQPYTMAAPTVKPPPIPVEIDHIRIDLQNDEENEYKIIDDYPQRL
ncbi:hypothetical protein WR25_16135 [Diploscapter pachys]|uniref:LRRCT domain-containing protein n=1 Tax=Diploscapter pachys TaxID=2018661 RepID=A0A2A2LB83_9BILA|nr:hypothetical protein WR25_16135 [Diploscapter pachys]